MDRTEFAKILKSIIIPEGISNEELNKVVFPISKAILQMLPNSLFRYRCCDDKGLQMDAFKYDKIYAVTADKFNDPYDTLVKFDIDNIKQVVDQFLNCDILKEMQQYFKQGNDVPDNVKQFFSPEAIDNLKMQILTISNIKEIENNIEDYKKQLLSQIEFWFPIYVEMNRKFATIACFCETIQSIIMWSHYADYHKGFALEYNSNELFEQQNIGVFPVIYDDERYEAPFYLMWFWAQMMGFKIPKPDMLSDIKCVLHKSKQWEYEKEWRMANYLPRNIFEESVSCISQKPIAIYYGCKISPENKLRLHEIAKSKKIAEYDMYIDYSSSKYEMLYRPTNLI